MKLSAKKTTDNKIKIRFEESTSFLEINIEHLKEDDWLDSKGHIAAIEEYLRESRKLTMVFTCGKPSTVTMRFIMRILKLAEEYQKREVKDFRIYWNFDVSKSYRDWLISKLRKSFDLDIKASRFLISGGLI